MHGRCVEGGVWGVSGGGCARGGGEWRREWGVVFALALVCRHYLWQCGLLIVDTVGTL